MTKESSKTLTGWICGTCGVQSAATTQMPEACPICLDERQYVGWAGQTWLTPDELASRHEIRFADEGGVTTIVMEPAFGIGQRAFLIPDGTGVMMWECLSVVTEAALARLKALGGVTRIAISHPHFYSAMVEWSVALGNIPIYLHAADRAWVSYPSNAICFWEGSRLPLSHQLELVHLPGHFPGSAGLWWKDGPSAGGSLFPGDAIQVSMDRRFASFMYSYPNGIPLGSKALLELERGIDGLVFDDVFGFAPGRQILGDGKARVAASFARYRVALAA